MDEYTSIYGYIKIYQLGSYDKSVDFIKSLGKDETYPFINSNMFSFGDYDTPYFYENPMFSFANTYKYFGIELKHWNDFVLKIENILRNVDFDNAQFHIESAWGEFTMYWQSKKTHKRLSSNEKLNDKPIQLTETEEWYFGFGKRSPYIGWLDEEKYDEEMEDLRSSKYDFIGFKYPIPK